jgi:hypothetical protein
MPLSSRFSEKIQITLAMRLLHAGVDSTVIALWYADNFRALTTTASALTRPFHIIRRSS